MLWAGALLGTLLAVLPRSALAASYVTQATPFNFLSSVGHTRITTWDGTVGCPDNGGDDSLSALINIGFTFRFGATNYTQLRVFTNGRVQFNNTQCNFGTQAVGPPRTYPDPMPAANLNNTMRIYGADLDNSAAGGGTITYASIGTAPNRTFVVTWNGVPQWSAVGTAYYLQIQLAENGDFYFMYGVSVNQTTAPIVVLGPAQIGWQLTTADYVIVQSGLPANNSGWRFRPNVPALTVAKASEVLSDPHRGSVNPLRVPGAIVRYNVVISNAGAGSVDASTVVITDPVPANTSLFVSTSGGPPVEFIDGTPASGLAFNYAANVSYSNQPGGVAPFTYIPVPDANGFDSAVTGVRIAPTGTFAGATGASVPSFTARFRVRVR